MEQTISTVLRVLSVTFALPEGYDSRLVPKLRGAIAHKAGLEHDEFHNHNNNAAAAVAFRYRYPLVQYRIQQGALNLVCWNEGVDALQHFFAQPDWTLALDTGDSVTLRIKEMQLRELQPTLCDPPRRYALRNWYALNQANFKTYISSTEAEQTELLERLLVSQIVMLLNTLGFHPTEPVTVKITALRSRITEHKRQKIRVFNPEFECNVFLPVGLGLGKAAAMGFGGIETRKETQIKRI